MGIEDYFATKVRLDAEKDAQAFIANDYLKNIKDTQPPKWVHFLILLLAALAAGIAIITLLLQLKVI